MGCPMFWSQEGGKKRIWTKEESSICERKSRGNWGSGGGDKQEGNGIFFSGNQWILLTVYREYCLSLEKLVHPLEADSFSAMRCPVYQSSLVHKQAMDLFTHFSNPLTKTRMVAAKLLPDTPCLEEEPHSNPSMVLWGALWHRSAGWEGNHISSAHGFMRNPGQCQPGMPISLHAGTTSALNAPGT